MTTTDTGRQTDWLQPGQIRTAVFGVRLADGSSTSDTREILILDVEHDPDPAWDNPVYRPFPTSHARVLWMGMSLYRGEPMPQSEPRWSTVTWTGDPVDRDAALTLSLHGSEVTDYYQPGSRGANDLAVLREQAHERAEYLEDWNILHAPADVAEAATAYRATQAAVTRTQAHLYERIRTALNRGTGVTELSNLTGLSRERIYQIRDNRR